MVSNEAGAQVARRIASQCCSLRLPSLFTLLSSRTGLHRNQGEERRVSAAYGWTVCEEEVQKSSS